MPWNVGVLGAGPGVAALHLPVLGRLAELFRVVHVADAGSGRAQVLAGQLGARWSAGEAGSSRRCECGCGGRVQPAR